MILDILHWPHIALRTKCNEITAIDKNLWLLIDNMWETMDAVEDMDAMGLAANQVGVGITLFIMRDSTGVKCEFLNPEWTPDGSGWACEDEGCLSSPGLFGQVHGRREKIMVKAMNRNGQKMVMKAEGIDAVCIQHEIDHLDGIFWFERMKRNPRRQMIRQWKARGGEHVIQST